MGLAAAQECLQGGVGGEGGGGAAERRLGRRATDLTSDFRPAGDHDRGLRFDDSKRRIRRATGLGRNPATSRVTG